MADEADMQESAQDSSVETTTADSQSEAQTQDSNATSTEGAGENQSGSNADSSASTGDKQPSGTQDGKQESKPLSRRSAAYRIQQLTRENRELRQQAGQPTKEQDEWGEAPAQGDSKPDIQALIDAAVEKRLNPIVSESTKTADDAEITELFSGDRASQRTEYEPQIRKLWELPQYKDVAASDLHAMLVGKNMDAIVQATRLQAVEDYKQAQKEAKESSGSGSSNTSNRTGKGGKSINDLSDEEFAQRNARIKAGLPV